MNRCRMNNRAAAGVDLRLHEEDTNCDITKYNYAQKNSFSLSTATSSSPSSSSNSTASGSCKTSLLHEERIAHTHSASSLQLFNSTLSSDEYLRPTNIEGDKVEERRKLPLDSNSTRGLNLNEKQQQKPGERRGQSHTTLPSPPPSPACPSRPKFPSSPSSTDNSSDNPNKEADQAHNSTPEESREALGAPANSTTHTYDQCLIPAPPVSSPFPSQLPSVLPQSAPARPTSSSASSLLAASAEGTDSKSPEQEEEEGAKKAESGRGEVSLVSKKPTRVTVKLCAKAAHRLRRVALSTPKSLSKLGERAAIDKTTQIEI